MPALMVLIPRYDFKPDGPALLAFVASNRTYWLLLQAMVLESSILAIVTFVALFAALKHINKSFAAIGAAVGVTAMVLFMAYYPVLLGLVYLSDQFAAAAEPRRLVLAGAAEALIAQNNAFNPIYESLLGVGVLILSLVMLKSRIFRKGLAYLGIATFAAAIAALALFSVIGLTYLRWWIFFTVWFIALGWRLIKLGRA